jgi:hypothetical protein
MKIKLPMFIICLVCLIAWDAFSRFTIEPQSYESTVDDELVSIDLPKVLSKEKLEELNKQYLVFDPQASSQNNTGDEQVMSLAEQQQQQGLLDQLYSGDLRISLKAVIREPVKGTNTDNIFALVLVENLKEKQQNLQKVKPLQQLFDYQVQQIHLDKIIFVSMQDNQRTVILSLYQKRPTASELDANNRKPI